MKFVAKDWSAWALKRRKRPVEPPVYGPPTAFEAQIAALFSHSNQYLAALYAEQLKTEAWLEGERWPDTIVRVRLPEDYMVNRIN